MVTLEVLVSAFSSLAALLAVAFFWILSEFRAHRREMQGIRDGNREDNQRTRQELREEIQRSREEAKADNQRILEALYFHRHDQDGAAVFYPPTPTTPSPPAAD